MGLYDNGLESADRAKATELRGQYLPLKFGSQTDRWGRSFVNVLPVLEWAEYDKEADFLVDKCESIYQSFAALEKTSHAIGKANGNESTNGHAKAQ